jgi:hypothetical protein
MRYQYTGPGPDESSGELIRPGDVREFAGPPAWGPWEPMGEPEAPEAPASEPQPADAVPVPPETAEGM